MRRHPNAGGHGEPPLQHRQVEWRELAGPPDVYCFEEAMSSQLEWRESAGINPSSRPVTLWN
jgi:hypothetical protein